MYKSSVGDCCDDIALIKSTVANSRFDYRALAIPFLLYGGLNFILEVLYVQLAFRFNYAGFWSSISFSGMKSAVMIATAVCYIYNLKMLRDRNNVATLQIYKIWGFVMLLIPCINLIWQFIYLATVKGYPKGALPISYIVITVIILYSFIVALLFTGVLLNDKFLTVMSILFVPFVVVLFLLGAGRQSIDTIERVADFVMNRMTVANMVMLFSYIWVGLYCLLLRREKK